MACRDGKSFEPVPADHILGSSGGYLASSVTSLTIGASGSRAFTTQKHLSYSAGARIRATSVGSGEWMEGIVDSYVGTLLTATMDKANGAGTHTDWDINVAGEPGADGLSNAAWLDGSGVPGGGLGNDGDKYLDVDNGDVYSKAAGSWTLVGNIHGADGLDGTGYGATSATSLVTAGTGSKSFTTQAGLAYVVGSRIRATSDGTGEWMEGLVSSYSGVTLVVDMDSNYGTGTHTDWSITIAGEPGVSGTQSFKTASTTSQAIVSTGSLSFTVDAGLAYSAGQRVRIYSIGGGSDYMEGEVTVYSGTTLTVAIDKSGGSGTHTDWNINLTGLPGIDGSASFITALARCASGGTMVNGTSTIVDFDSIGTNDFTMITRPGGVWTCTLPTTRPYRILVDVLLAAYTYSVGDVMTLELWVNGSLVAVLHRLTLESTTSQNIHFRGTIAFDGTAADTLNIRVGNSSGSDKNISASSAYSHFGIMAA